MAIRLKVKEALQVRKLSQRKLFFLSQVDLKAIQKIVNHPTEANITMDTLDRLAKALNVDASLLIESDPPLPKTLEKDLE